MLKCITTNIYDDELLWDSIVSYCSDKCCAMIYYQTTFSLEAGRALWFE